MEASRRGSDERSTVAERYRLLRACGWHLSAAEVEPRSTGALNVEEDVLRINEQHHARHRRRDRAQRARVRAVMPEEHLGRAPTSWHATILASSNTTTPSSGRR